MSIPSNITTELTSLQSQVAAALPLSGATRATIQALQLNADNLVSDLDTAVANAAGQLDTWVPPTDPQLIISQFLTLVTNGTDQWNLSVMRGLVGRVASNLDQLGPTPAVPPPVPVVPLTFTMNPAQLEVGQPFIVGQTIIGRYQAPVYLRRFRFN